MSGSSIVLHTTPPLGQLPASDADSLRLLCTLRQAGITSQVETADWSANGQPFVTLDGVAIQERYFSSLPGWSNPDAALSEAQTADAVQWKAYVRGQVCDLVNHTMYSLPPNHPMLAKAQLAVCPFPLNFYVPQRIRSIHKARLEAAGLWNLGGAYANEDNTPSKPLSDSIIVAPGGTRTERVATGVRDRDHTRKFGEEALRQRARTVFDPLARKLGDSRYFYNNKISTLDIALFAQLAMLLCVSWPNPLLTDLLRGEYPTLVAHNERVLKKVLPGGWASVQRTTPSATPSTPSAAAIPWRSYLPTWLGGATDTADEQKKAPTDPEKVREREMESRLRWGRYAWFAGAGLTFITYLFASGLIEIDLGEGGDLGDDDEYEDEEGYDGPWLEGEDDEIAGGGGLPVWEDDEIPDGEMPDADVLDDED